MTSYSVPPTWTPGAPLTADELNTYIRDNLTHLTEVQDWSPTLRQPSVVSRTLSTGRYWRTGKRVHGVCFLSATSAGTSGNSIVATLPAEAAANWATLSPIGTGWVYDVSTATFYQGAALLASSTTVGVRINGEPGFVGGTPSFALASGDLFAVSIDYEAA